MSDPKCVFPPLLEHGKEARPLPESEGDIEPRRFVYIKLADFITNMVADPRTPQTLRGATPPHHTPAEADAHTQNRTLGWPFQPAE